MTAQPEETFLVAYPCQLRCLVEVDLTGIHSQFTHRQMRVKADALHQEMHGPPQVAAPIHDLLAATFRSPVSR